MTFSRCLDEPYARYVERTEALGLRHRGAANVRSSAAKALRLRTGRCLQEAEFPAFTSGEANRWLGDAGCADRVSGAHTLAELYAIRGGATPVAGASTPMGFS